MISTAVFEIGARLETAAYKVESLTAAPDDIASEISEKSGDSLQFAMRKVLKLTQFTRQKYDERNIGMDNEFDDSNIEKAALGEVEMAFIEAGRITGNGLDQLQAVKQRLDEIMNSEIEPKIAMVKKICTEDTARLVQRKSEITETEGEVKKYEDARQREEEALRELQGKINPFEGMGSNNQFGFLLGGMNNQSGPYVSSEQVSEAQRRVKEAQAGHQKAMEKLQRSKHELRLLTDAYTREQELIKLSDQIVASAKEAQDKCLKAQTKLASLKEIPLALSAKVDAMGKIANTREKYFSGILDICDQVLFEPQVVYEAKLIHGEITAVYTDGVRVPDEIKNVLEAVGNKVSSIEKSNPW